MKFNNLGSAMDAADPENAYEKAINRLAKAEEELAKAQANLKYWKEEYKKFKNQNR